MKFKLTDVNEKDIDLLLAEEFASSPSFLSLFLGKLDSLTHKGYLVQKIYRSNTDNFGESDLEIYLQNEQEHRLVLLIENKIAAQFQQDQLARYNKRGKSYLDQNKCEEFKTILVAPQEYMDDFSQLEADTVVFYEEVKSWLEKSSMSAGRREYKETLIDRALEKAKIGYQLIEDKKASDFWEDYWKAVNEIAPKLNMPKPGPKPSGSSFIYFYPPGIPDSVSLVHKFSYGNIDIQISGAAKKTGLIYKLFSDALPSNYLIEQAGKSAVIRTKVPVLDINTTIDSQSNKFHHCIQQINTTYNWLAEHTDRFKKIIDTD